MKETIKVWKFDACDYVAGLELERTKTWYENLTGVQVEECEECSISTIMDASDRESGEPPRRVTFEQWISECFSAGESLPLILATDPHYA